ncbi:hypothetical protein [Snodgrassella alvi]|uniref:hypothetical protein n=1 Tax=Snodgrassella alvi TaxID=1196083 RepID=UPI000C1DFAC9|nr:hypothetical protein [Snodgrassella alvi]PIT35558.1 hypothetical protein BHC50_00390 [Snodgrassella alvi]PIT36922.1 hypothetical protein BHC42_02160 [Snodgrassella alvi]WLT04276.1 hypothetical protein RAM23_10860 [Snodgrassella alvi]
MQISGLISIIFAADISMDGCYGFCYGFAGFLLLRYLTSNDIAGINTAMGSTGWYSHNRDQNQLIVYANTTLIKLPLLESTHLLI